MPRKKTEEIVDDDDAFDFSLSSQPSDSYDDHFLRALAEHAAAKEAKERQEFNRKFIEAASSSLDKLLLKPVEAAEEAVESIEEVYGNFILEYAASEDRIHRLWAEITKQYTELDAFLREKHQAALVLAHTREQRHIASFSKMVGACDDFKTVVQSLVPETEDMMSL